MTLVPSATRWMGPNRSAGGRCGGRAGRGVRSAGTGRRAWLRHTDLLAAGPIPDPYLDDNEMRLGWIGEADWVYETRFSWSDGGGPEVDLVCAGLDTVATLTLNGVQVGQTANMHRSHVFPVRHLLHEGENHLQVRFDSAYRYARQLAERLGSVRALTTMDTVAVHVDLARAASSAGEPPSVSAVVPGARMEVVVPPHTHSVVLNLPVPGAEPWWPRGYGEQHRHQLDVALHAADGTVLDTWQRQIGFRSVRVDTTPDAGGTPFTLVVNDVPVFVRGANWIPDDAFPHRIDRERYARRLAQACEANVNLLRVWGGGIYEADDFYDLADEYGLMVMQDFLFACAAYPEEPPLAEEVDAEARDNVARLASHPSLVMWIGNNENVWGHVEWGWGPKLEGRTWGAGVLLRPAAQHGVRSRPFAPVLARQPVLGQP